MQRQTLDRYVTKRCRFQVEEDENLQDQPASLQSLMDEVREEVPIADSSTPKYMSTGEPSIRHAKL